MYKKFVIKEKGKNVFYVQLKKALYGMISAALLFWKRLTEVLKAGALKSTYMHVWQVVNAQ
jgi:hypothetical protein